MTLPTYASLLSTAERTFELWGPNSGGGQRIVLHDGRLYDVVYGDESRLPGGAEHVRAVYTPSEMITLFGASPLHAPVVAYLRERGLV
jgi:hypothetical protein